MLLKIDKKSKSCKLTRFYWHSYVDQKYFSFSFYRNQYEYNCQMNSQKIKKSYHSFVPQKQSYGLRPNSTPLFLLSSPKTQRLQNQFSVLQLNNACQSSNLTNQPTDPNLASLPHKCLTMRDINNRTAENEGCADKEKRFTLAMQRTRTLGASQKQISYSPQKQPKAQVKFTYLNKKEMEEKIRFSPSCENSRVLVFQQKTQQPLSKSKSKIKSNKISRNKLCFTEYSYVYQPFSAIKKKGQQLQELLEQLKRQTDLLSSKVLWGCQFSKESKASAAETSTSAMAGVKSSQVTIDSSRWSSQSNSKCNFQPSGFNLPRASLTDKIPSSKQLGKTIILNPNSYDFGGIITSNQKIQQFNADRKPIEQGLMRNWGQIKGLLSQDNEQSMKESIHCGPDVRANNVNCEMLQNFGREIKESTLSYHE